MFSQDKEEQPPPLSRPPPPPPPGVLRASGKRFRRQFNPNDWESSILTIRHNILCLGMSYPCAEKVIAHDMGKNVQIFHSDPSVERSVELVRRNLLNQIDGRDLARVVALEANNDILAYTVSKEEGTYYHQRHLNADFNSRTLMNQIHMRWGKTVRFRQVILDYFWSPSGSWAIKHWQRSFFNENIPRLVTENLFNFGDLENDSLFVSAREVNTAEDFICSTSAVVYLPFCLHCLSEVVACHRTLSQFYTISFLRKDQLDEHSLWKATNTISPESMKGWLAKTINQEEIYCTIDSRQIKHGAGDTSVTTEDILDVFYRIERSAEVRMIKLTALRKFHPDYPKSDIQRARSTLGLNKGGYVGLQNKHPTTCNNADNGATVTIMERLYPMKQVDQTKRQGILRKRSLSCPQLNRLGSRKREKRDYSVTDHAPASSTSDINYKDYPINNSQNEEPQVPMGLALEWENFMTSFELDTIKRDNFGVSRSPHEVATEALLDGRKTLGRNGSVEADNSTKEKLNSCLVSDTPESNRAELSPKPSKSLSILAEEHPSLAPEAMRKIALRRSTGKIPVKNDSKAQKARLERTVKEVVEILENNETSPNTNDILIGATHYSHPGNMQFFNALSICADDFSMMSECFVDALKSLDPPGRFLGNDEVSGKWTCIDYFAAIKFVSHLLDDYNQNNFDGINQDNERSSAFLYIAQQFFNSKFKKGVCQGKIEQTSHPSITKIESIAPYGQCLPREASGNNGKRSQDLELSAMKVDKGVVLPAFKDEGPSARNKSSTFDTDKKNIWVTKLEVSKQKAKKDNLFTALALAECRKPNKMNISVYSVSMNAKNLSSLCEVNENINGIEMQNATKERARTGKSLELALAECKGTEKADTSDTEEMHKFKSIEENGASHSTSFKENKSEPSLPSLALDEESMTITSMEANNDKQTVMNHLDLADPVCEGTTSSARDQTKEEASFRCLAEWLQPTIGSSQEHLASIEVALKQISKQGFVSAYMLLAHAFEEEKVMLCSLFTVE